MCGGRGGSVGIECRMDAADVGGERVRERSASNTRAIRRCCRMAAWIVPECEATSRSVTRHKSA